MKETFGKVFGFTTGLFAAIMVCGSIAKYLNKSNESTNKSKNEEA